MKTEDRVRSDDVKTEAWPKGYDALLSAVDSVVEHYRDDLLHHDFVALLRSPGVQFLHWARSTGTRLQFFSPAAEFPAKGDHVPYLFGVKERRGLAKVPREVAEYCARDIGRADHPEEVVHYFDGQTLRKVTHDKAVDLAKQYERRINAEFDAK